MSPKTLSGDVGTLTRAHVASNTGHPESLNRTAYRLLAQVLGDLSRLSATRHVIQGSHSEAAAEGHALNQRLDKLKRELVESEATRSSRTIFTGLGRDFGLFAINRRELAQLRADQLQLCQLILKKKPQLEELSHAFARLLGDDLAALSNESQTASVRFEGYGVSTQITAFFERLEIDVMADAMVPIYFWGRLFSSDMPDSGQPMRMDEMRQMHAAFVALMTSDADSSHPMKYHD